MQLIQDIESPVGYLVPFLASLKQQMSIKFVYDHLLSSFEENRQRKGNPYEEINDFWEGSFIQSTPLYIEQQGAVIAIQVYYDEVEPAKKSLGSKKGQHNISILLDNTKCLLKLVPTCVA